MMPERQLIFSASHRLNLQSLYGSQSITLGTAQSKYLN